MKKTVWFLGSEWEYDSVYYYYSMLKQAYYEYTAQDYRHITPTKRLYIISFKKKIDDMAELLGLDERIELPKYINSVKPQNEET